MQLKQCLARVFNFMALNAYFKKEKLKNLIKVIKTNQHKHLLH